MKHQYYVNENAQNNGDHEVHRRGCKHFPHESNAKSLGLHEDCESAVKEAEKHYSQVNGCFYCSLECNTQ